MAGKIHAPMGAVGDSIVHYDDHMEDVCRVLRVKPRKDTLNFGVEIEVGWKRLDQRDLFLEDLGKLGLNKKLISKHDGTIGGRNNKGNVYDTEIVTGAFGGREIREIVHKVAARIESHANAGLITEECGVHVHVSDAPLTRDQVWRVASSIMFDREHVRVWQGGPHVVASVALWQAEASHINAFWNAVCLREPTKKCQRNPQQNVHDLWNYRKDHDRAIQMGRATPTLEYRMMRTARSARVTESYIDLAESHVEFCANPPPEFLSRVPVPADWEAVGWPPKPYAKELSRRAREIFVRIPPTDEIECRRDYFFVDASSGTKLEAAEIQTVDYNGVLRFYPSNDTLRNLGQCVPPASRHSGAVGWHNGIFPLSAYIKYVLDNEKRFPALAARLRLKRFEPFTRETAASLPRDLTVPHLEFAQDCLVESERYDGQFYIVSAIDPERPAEEVTLQIVGGEYLANSTLVDRVQFLTHVCPGALERGGES